MLKNVLILCKHWDTGVNCPEATGEQAKGPWDPKCEKLYHSGDGVLVHACSWMDYG